MRERRATPDTTRGRSRPTTESVWDDKAATVCGYNVSASQSNVSSMTRVSQMCLVKVWSARSMMTFLRSRFDERKARS